MLPSIHAPDTRAEAFPVLTPAQIDRIRPYGKIRPVQPGEVLFEPGTADMPCFVVLSGKLDIAMAGLSGEHIFVTYGPGQFSGEVISSPGRVRFLAAELPTRVSSSSSAGTHCAP
jgi:thioredoxin reductase (NADPH)